jgi:hypothetical protein
LKPCKVYARWPVQRLFSVLPGYLQELASIRCNTVECRLCLYTHTHTHAANCVQTHDETIGQLTFLYLHCCALRLHYYIVRACNNKQADLDASLKFTEMIKNAWCSRFSTGILQLSLLSEFTPAAVVEASLCWIQWHAYWVSALLLLSP